jgi:hypothetical protein
MVPLQMRWCNDRSHRVPVLHQVETASKITFWTVLFLTVGEDLPMAVGVGHSIGFFLSVHDMSELWKPTIKALPKISMAR